VNLDLHAGDDARAAARGPIPFRSGRGYDAGVSLSQIRYFVAVAEEGNVGRAARRLRVSQPPLSRSIRSLEDELGTRMFERTPRGMRLLPAGAAFLHHARRVLAEVDEAAAAARAAPPANLTSALRPARR
jgi:DNA-binding transcriptional LysR family regulator